MKSLVIGLGSIGSRHVKNLYKLGIKDISVLRARNLAPPTKIKFDIKYFSNFEDAINTKPEIIVIANPTSLHLEFLIKSLDAGCHIYVEKPISHNLDNIEKLLLRKLKSSVVQVGCQLRCHPHLLKIKKMISNGELGKIISVVADVGEYLPGWHPWEDYRNSYAARKDQGGGVILTMIHEIDYLYWLFGPLSVEHAMGGTLTNLEIDVEDTALIAMKSEKDVLIHLRLDYWRKPPKRTLNIVAEKGEVFWDFHKRELSFYAGGELVNTNILSSEWDRNDLFLDMMQNFLMATKGNESVCSPLNEGVEVLKLALSAQQLLKQ